MNELQVVVEQTPGVIRWNFEDLKAAVADQMQFYENVVYDDENIKTAKKDVATLRKLKKAVEDKRIEIKKKFMEPYTAVEDQVKELTALIDKPIASIDTQVKAYETAQRDKRKKAILDYMNEKFASFVPNIKKKMMFKFYDARWENSTSKASDWQAAIDSAAKATQNDLDIINGVELDFWETAFTTYQQNLVLSEALNKVQELRRQKEMILEQERRRREAEEARKTFIAAQQAQQQQPAETPAAAAETLHEPATQRQEPAAQHNQPQATAPRQNNPATGRTVIIKASDAQYRKILAYISYVGAEYREV